MLRTNVLILKFPYSSLFGGGEKHTLTLVEKLQPHCQFYLLSNCGVLVPEFKQRHWSVQTIWAGTEPVTPKALLLFLFTAPLIWGNLSYWLIKYKIQHHINVVFCLSLTEKILITPLARLLGCQVIWMEHLQIERSLRLSPLRLLYILWSRLAMVVTVVEAVREQLERLGVPTKHIRVIYNAIDIKKFKPHPTPVEKLVDQYRVLFIGRLSEEKGVTDLLKALVSVRKIIPQLRCTIIGTGPLHDVLVQQCNDLELTDCVEFVGFQEDIAEWLRRGDVVVLPSTHRETFGLVLAEALATVKPVVATTTGGLREVVNKAGWLVEPHQPTQLAEAIIAVYENYPLALHRAQQGRLRVLELFEERRMIEEYAQLFHN